jgi:hypothetical protein
MFFFLNKFYNNKFLYYLYLLLLYFIISNILKILSSITRQFILILLNDTCLLSLINLIWINEIIKIIKMRKIYLFIHK